MLAFVLAFGHKKLQNCQRYIDAKPLREAATENRLLPAVIMNRRCENDEIRRVQSSHPRPLRFAIFGEIIARNHRSRPTQTIICESYESRSRTSRHPPSPILFAQFLIFRIRETMRFAPRLTRERTAQCLHFGIRHPKIAPPATLGTMSKPTILRRIKPMPAPVELRFGAQ